MKVLIPTGYVLTAEGQVLYNGPRFDPPAPECFPGPHARLEIARPMSGQNTALHLADVSFLRPR
jgi:hypothetical protein